MNTRYSHDDGVCIGIAQQAVGRGGQREVIKGGTGDYEGNFGGGGRSREVCFYDLRRNCWSGLEGVSVLA